MVTPAHAGERELEVFLRMELEYQDRRGGPACKAWDHTRVDPKAAY